MALREVESLAEAGLCDQGDWDKKDCLAAISSAAIAARLAKSTDSKKDCVLSIGYLRDRKANEVRRASTVKCVN